MTYPVSKGKVMRQISIALAITLSASVADAKDMFYTLASQWCSTEWTNNKPSQFTITEQGILTDGVISERPPRCMLKSATNKNAAYGEHNITWRCDPTPPHERDDKPTPLFKYYETSERLFTFLIHDSAGGRRFFMMRDKLPVGRSPVRLYEQCE